MPFDLTNHALPVLEAPPSTLATGPSPPVRLLTRLGLAAALLWSAPALACSICACGDPLLSAADPAAMTGKLRLQIDAEYLRIDAANDADPAATDQLTQWSYRLNAAWRPTEALTLTATLPVLEKVIRTVGAGPTTTASDLSGLGDAELGGRYALWRSVAIGSPLFQELAVSAGAALPTGQHQAKDADGAVIDPHGQLGTGGWGPFAGLHYRAEWNDWTVFASAAYRIRTEGRFADPAGTFKYRFGDAFLWSAHAQLLAVRWLAVDLGLDGRIAAKDKATDPDGASAPVENTGGTGLSLAPGLYANAAGPFWVFARGQLPVYQALLGRQDVKPSFTVGVQVQVL